MKIPDAKEIRRRLKAKEYLVTPDGPPGEMNEKEALLWEKACLEARLKITEDHKRKPGLLFRIQEIELMFRNKKAVTKYKEIMTGPFENEIEPVKSIEFDDTVGFENEVAPVIEPTPEPEPEPLVNDEPIPEVVINTTVEEEIEQINQTIEDDPLFD